MRVNKYFLVILLWFHLLSLVLFFLGNNIHLNKYVGVDFDVRHGEHDGEIFFRVRDMDFVAQKVYLRIREVPEKYLTAMSASLPITKKSNMKFEVDGEISSRLMCRDVVELQEGVPLKGVYSVSGAVAMVHLANVKYFRGCDLELRVLSNSFSELLPSMEVVRGADGELFGLDLRSAPVVLPILNVGYYLVLWYYSAFGGVPLFIGLGLVLMSFCVFLFGRR